MRERRKRGILCVRPVSGRRVVTSVSCPMGLPGHRRTSSHKRRRASHFALKKLSLRECAKCKKPVLPHTACAACGTYAGRVVVKMPAPALKKAKGAPAAGAGDPPVNA